MNAKFDIVRAFWPPTRGYRAIISPEVLVRLSRLLRTSTALCALAVLASPAAAQTNDLPANSVVYRVNVLKNGKLIKTEPITVGGVRATYESITKTVQQYGLVGVKGWKRKAYNMTAVARCGFLLETFVAIQGIKEGKLDSTPAIEKTAYDIVLAISEVNEESSVGCERVGH